MTDSDFGIGVDEILWRKSDEIWRRIDSIMAETMKDYKSDDESDSDDDGHVKIDSLIEDIDRKARGFFKTSTVEAPVLKSDNEDPDDLDFAQRAISKYGEYNSETTSSFEERGKMHDKAFTSRDRPKNKIANLHAQSLENEKAVLELYGASDDASADVKPKPKAKSRNKASTLFHRRMSVDPLDSAMNALNGFGTFDSVKE